MAAGSPSTVIVGVLELACGKSTPALLEKVAVVGLSVNVPGSVDLMR
jgi:hypothetical protein